MSITLYSRPAYIQNNTTYWFTFLFLRSTHSNNNLVNLDRLTRFWLARNENLPSLLCFLSALFPSTPLRSQYISLSQLLWLWTTVYQSLVRVLQLTLIIKPNYLNLTWILMKHSNNKTKLHNVIFVNCFNPTISSSISDMHQAYIKSFYFDAEFITIL